MAGEGIWMADKGVWIAPNSTIEDHITDQNFAHEIQTQESQVPESTELHPNATVLLHKKFHPDFPPLSSFKGNALKSPCIENDFSVEVDQNKECQNLLFPLVKSKKDVTPDHCWPKFVVMPSYPTSGSELVQGLFRVQTGLATGARYQSEGSLFYGWGSRPN